MDTIVPVDAALLAQMVATGARGPTGLTPRAFAQYATALSRTRWGGTHLRAVALVDVQARVLASALVYALDGMLGDRPVAICAVGDIIEYADEGAGRHTAELSARVVEEAEGRGIGISMIAAPANGRGTVPDGFRVLPTMDLTLLVTESTRRGAPMAPVRWGHRDDLAIIAAIPLLGSPPRFRLDRNADFMEFALTRRRLLAGLSPIGERELRFLVVEEGMRAAAYVVISVANGRWVIEECGDRDPTGARIGAMLQSLIAREPAERRPTITAWLPSGFVPPQVTVVSAQPSADRLWVRSRTNRAALQAMSDADVAYWHGDVM